ncbi:hypothetical protein GCM10022403_034850 [Streptomyces coacervatus]|uniref:Uncharacterized protein n=1 Tax=Streptomyces coacervatus TaxID=647381 RepID=A0ABP7HNK6_9ACTN|nr:hypothetical protein [Streptomyces coacervatus]MDF2272041.1 hypothetical protein [Streptomyces coacervatus]
MHLAFTLVQAAATTLDVAWLSFAAAVVSGLVTVANTIWKTRHEKKMAERASRREAEAKAREAYEACIAAVADFWLDLRPLAQELDSLHAHGATPEGVRRINDLLGRVSGSLAWAKRAADVARLKGIGSMADRAEKLKDALSAVSTEADAQLKAAETPGAKPDEGAWRRSRDSLSTALDRFVEQAQLEGSGPTR